MNDSIEDLKGWVERNAELVRQLAEARAALERIARNNYPGASFIARQALAAAKPEEKSNE